MHEVGIIHTWEDYVLLKTMQDYANWYVRAKKIENTALELLFPSVSSATFYNNPFLF